MKIEKVYKLTTRGMQSCLVAYENTPQDIKNFLGLIYSTSSWTLPNINFNGSSAIYVFKQIDAAKKFVKNNPSLEGNSTLWEAQAFNVRKRKTFMRLNGTITLEDLKNYWKNIFDGLVFRKTKQNFYVADGVRLVKIIENF